jgi:hypothetical protein
MKFSQPCILTGMILLLVTFPILSGCATSQYNNLTAAELEPRYPDRAGRIRDYQAEYFSAYSPHLPGCVATGKTREMTEGHIV